MQTSQEYFTTIVYAKFGGQTECIMDNWKIVNDTARKIDHSLLIHIIKVFKQWPIDFEKISPSLLSAAQLTLAGLYTSH